MNPEKLRARRIAYAGFAFQIFASSIARLGRALWQQPESDFTREAALLRFDVCVDAACHAIRAFAAIDQGTLEPGINAPIRFAREELL